MSEATTFLTSIIAQYFRAYLVVCLGAAVLFGLLLVVHLMQRPPQIDGDSLGLFAIVPFFAPFAVFSFFGPALFIGDDNNIGWWRAWLLFNALNGGVLWALIWVIGGVVALFVGAVSATDFAISLFASLPVLCAVSCLASLVWMGFSWVRRQIAGTLFGDR